MWTSLLIVLYLAALPLITVGEAAQRGIIQAPTSLPTGLAKSTTNMVGLVPKSGLIDGKPQGVFIGISVLSGNPVFLLFLDKGRVFNGLPSGGLNKLDWEGLVKDSPNSVGDWSVSSGRLSIRWRSGGSWENTITPTPRGMQFNGKSYSAAAFVSVAQLSGIFEGSRSTAWMNVGRGGPSVTQATTLLLDGKGAFTFDSASVSNVVNAVAYSSSNLSGTMSIEGYDAVLQFKDGHSERLTIVGFPDDYSAFILSGNFYTKKK